MFKNKNLAILFGCLSLLFLGACSRDEAPEAEEPPIVVDEADDEEPKIAFEFTVTAIDDEELEALGEHIEVDYQHLRQTTFTGLNLLFQFNQPVGDFALIEVTHDLEGVTVKAGVLHEVGNLTPTTPLVVTGFVTLGTTPNNGFYFTDPEGNGNWFSLSVSPIDGAIGWQAFDWNHDNELFVLDGSPSQANPGGIQGADDGAVETAIAGVHVVVSGDTLFAIAQAYGVSVQDLQLWNRLGDSTHIPVGRVLIIDANLAPATQSPYRPLLLQGATNVAYPHPFGNEMDNVVFAFGDWSDWGDLGETIVISINEAVRNLQVVPVDFQERELGVYAFTFHVDAPFFQAPEMLEQQHLMIHNWSSGGMLSQGLIFDDLDGNTRRFVFGIDSQNGGLILLETIDGFTVLQAH